MKRLFLQRETLSRWATVLLAVLTAVMLLRYLYHHIVLREPIEYHGPKIP